MTQSGFSFIPLAKRKHSSGFLDIGLARAWCQGVREGGQNWLHETNVRSGLFPFQIPNKTKRVQNWRKLGEGLCPSLRKTEQYSSKSYTSVKFSHPIKINIRIYILWNVTPCLLIRSYPCFGRFFSINLQGLCSHWLYKPKLFSCWHGVLPQNLH